ncbi:Acyl-coenzyme A thioesterase 9, mitochondrial [Entophlyctis luteolus]|nr:Acyl-coenzyme A thioesterase 9, mitochondrial [Entophlyctis luteolus]
MSDSLTLTFLPFRSDPHLAEEYVGPFGRIRVGKVLEEMDALAAAVAFSHCSKDFTIVTASVDRIDMVREIPPNEDISIFGFVTYVGNSSMEISIQMEAIPPEAGISLDDMDDSIDSEYKRSKMPENSVATPRENMILSAKFIMARNFFFDLFLLIYPALQVARDPSTNKSVRVPQLRLDTDVERQIFAEGAKNKAMKQIQAQTALIHRPPSIEEMTLVHNLYKEYIKYLAHTNSIDHTGVAGATSAVPKPDNVVWMKDTRIQNINLTFPQDRNMHNKIFGGYLMRLAFEVASANSIMFHKSPLKFVSIDDVTFSRPVEIGAILDLRSQIVYTNGSKIVVKVVAHVVDAVSGNRDLSNEFWITFEREDGCENKRIMPRSYNDCMLYLEGKRRVDA